MSTQRKLNSLLTSEKIKALKRYFQTGEKPPQRGLRKRGILEQFELKNDDLVYKPEDLIIVEPEEIENVLTQLYNQLSKSLGKGITSFYKAVCSEYVGITRQDIANFLRKQPTYQLRLAPPKKLTNRAILASYPKNSGRFS